MRTTYLIIALSLAMAWLATSRTCSAQSMLVDPKAEPGRRSFCETITGQTLGGVMLWDDQLFFQDWRIQRNVVTGHFRLLDGQNQRFASGSFEECVETLAAIRLKYNLPPMCGRAVILLHGLGGVRATMSPIAYALEKRGYQVFNVTYASTHGSLGEHATSLASIVAHLDGIEEINFVGHSTGNLVIRHYLGDTTDPRTGHTPDPRIRRIVMIAPPNNGSEKARNWGDSRLFAAVVGETGVQLGIGWESVAPRLATPACEFGVIAGGKGDNQGYSSKLPGDDDGLLTVSTTLLPGASDFVLLNYRHNLMLLSSITADCTCRFLEQGFFRTPELRTPIVQ